MSTESNEHLPEAIVSERSQFSIIWLVPVIALAVAAYLIYDTYSGRGPMIEITFEDGSGLIAGKTEIQYLGVKVGVIESVTLDEKLSKVVLRARLDKSAAGLATEGAAFWVVRPEIGFGGVRGLDTLISGPYIGVIPGDGNSPIRRFNGLPEQPATSPNEPGLTIVLQADKLGSLQIGDPVYYREFPVGQVDQVSLASDARSVHAHVHIKADYAALVRTNTRFWNASGIGMHFSLFGGAKINTESLASILSGGVAFATPPENQMGSKVSDGTVFKLFDNPEEGWDNWSPTIEIPDTATTLQSAPLDQSANESAQPIDQPDPNNATVDQPDGTSPVAGEEDDGPGKKSGLHLHGPPGRHR